DAAQGRSKAGWRDIVQVQAGGTFRNLLLPERTCDDAHWIIIRTSAADSKLPKAGTRLTPCYAGVSALPGRPALQCGSTENVLARIESNGRGGSGAILLAPAANHYRLIGLEVTRADSRSLVYNLIGPDKQPADHIVLDRMWIHGSAQDETVRGIMISNIRYAAVVD